METIIATGCNVGMCTDRMICFQRKSFLENKRRVVL